MINLLFSLIIFMNVPVFDDETANSTRNTLWNNALVFHNSDPQKAIDGYKEALKVKSHPFLYTNIADCYVLLNNIEEATKYYETAESLLYHTSKYSAFPYAKYGYFLWKYKKDKEKALKFVNTSLEIEPANTEYQKYKEDIENNKTSDLSDEPALEQQKKNIDENIKNDKEININETKNDDEEIIIDETSDDYFKNIKTNSFIQTTQFRGYFKSKLLQDRVMENGLEDASESRNYIFLELKHELTENISIMLSSMVTRNYFMERNEGNAQYLILNGENFKNTDEYLLEESYIERKSKQYTLRVGQQIFKWGENTGFSRSDIINPVDLRESIIPDIDKRKIPVFAINGGITFDNSKLTLLYLPVRYNSKVDLWGSDFALIQPTKQVDTSVINNFIDSSIENDIQSISPVSEEEITNMSFALHFASTIKSFNYSFLVYYGFQQFPEMHIDSDVKKLFIELLSGTPSNAEITTISTNLIQKYMLGEDIFHSKFTRYFATTFSASYPIKSVILKLDLLFSPNRLYYTDVTNDTTDEKAIEESFVPFEKKVIDWTLGGEYQYKVDKLLIDFEIMGSYILNDDGEDYFYDRKNKIGLFSFAKWKLNDDYDLFVLGNFNFFTNDYLGSIRLTYKINKHNFTIAYNHFGGDFETPVGRYDKNDQFFLEYKLFYY